MHHIRRQFYKTDKQVLKKMKKKKVEIVIAKKKI